MFCRRPVFSAALYFLRSGFLQGIDRITCSAMQTILACFLKWKKSKSTFIISWVIYKKSIRMFNVRSSDFLHLDRLADLMEAHKEELATLESLDSGAVYTLALKTHIGMSIDTFRYFAGWCDKIEGSVIPINHARPNRNLTFTRREPIGWVLYFLKQCLFIPLKSVMLSYVH